MAAQSGESSAYPSSTVAWFSVVVLMLMYVFSFIDRTILSLLIGPMKRDLHITDVQVGLLQGLAFALLYTFLGLPIARLSDRYNRKSIVAVGVLIWSVMACLCGLARTAGQLFLARIGVGVGEAALSPAAYSMITDSFPRSKLASAFSVYNVGITMGSGIALLVGGLVVGAVSRPGASYTLPLFGEVHAWQMVFIVTGAPGLLLPLLLLTFPEPARRGLLRSPASAATPAAPLKPPLRDVVRFIWRNKNFYAPHFLAMALLAMAGYAAVSWLPEALIRAYPVTAAEAGKYIGICTIVMNSTGMLLAGVLCDRLTRGGAKDAPIIVACISACGISTLSCFPSLMPTITWVWIALFAQGMTFNAFNAVGPMAVNQVTPNQFRAQVSAVYLFVVNSIGLGLGPALVPILNQALFHDPAKIRFSLVIVVFGSAATAATLLFTERPAFRQRLTEAMAWQ